MLRVLRAEEGKTFRSKETGEIVSDLIYLGAHDSEDNYELVDKPINEENSLI